MKEGWEIKKLGEVCEMYQPKTISTKEMVDDGQYPVFGANGIIGKYDKYNHEEPQLLITCRGATCGSVNISEPKSWINGNAMVVRPKDHTIDLKFLEYLFRGGVDLSRTITGAAQPQITRQSLNPIEISYPKSLHEQQRIVSILDQCFTAIDKAKANAEQNLKNAKELFESYLQGVFENGNWEERVLGDLCLLITKGSSPKWQGIKYVDEPGILFVTSENVGEGKMLLNKRKYVEEKFNLKDKKSILKKGDVLTNIVGASIGRTAIYDIDDVANINQAVCILRCNPELILNNYLMNLLNSPFLKKILHDNEVNTARANLSLGFFNKLSIPCPSIEEQQTIVRQLDALRTETQKLEAVYQQKIDDLEELKKSILQKAFAGELRSPEGVASANDGYSPSEKKTKNKISPERA